MKPIWAILAVWLCLAAGVRAQPPADMTPAISLFDSVDTVRAFLAGRAKLDYSDKYLSGVILHYSAGHPKKGLAWVYSFSFKQPRLGGDVSIYHYMDGTILEFKHGP